MSRDLGAMPNPKRLFTGLVASFLAVALLPLLLELHATSQEHSALDWPVEVFTAATHPSLPAHFEASGSIERERCTYCILQLQSLGRLEAAPVLVARPRSSLAQFRRRWRTPVFAPFIPSSPRAPPAATSAA
jgi:hypothetical protein